MDNPIDYLMVTAYHLGYLDGVLGERTGRHRGMNVNEILQQQTGGNSERGVIDA